MIEAHHLEVVDSRHCDYDEQLRSLSPQERSRSQTFRYRIHRQGWVYAHARLRHVLAPLVGCSPTEVQFGRTPCPVCGNVGGRPVLAMQGRDNLHFSISHSDWLVAIVVADRPIGIDVQVEMPTASALVKELGPIEQHQIGESVARMTRCWTRKEAVLKAAGIGVAHGVRDPHVGGADHPYQPKGFVVSDLSVPYGFHGAVAITNEIERTER